MAIAFVQGATSGVGPGFDSRTATLAGAPTPGNLLIAQVGARISDPPAGLTWPSGWLVAASAVNTPGHGAYWVQLRYKIATAADLAALTVTATVGGQWNTPCLHYAEYSGVGVLDPSAPAGTAYAAIDNTPTMPAVDPADGPTALLIIAATLYPDVGAEWADTQGFTRRLDAHQGGGGNRMRYSLFDRIVSPAVGPYNGDFTVSTPNLESSVWVHRAFDPAAANAFAGEPGGGIW